MKLFEDNLQDFVVFGIITNFPFLIFYLSYFEIWTIFQRNLGVIILFENSIWYFCYKFKVFFVLNIQRMDFGLKLLKFIIDKNFEQIKEVEVWVPVNYIKLKLFWMFDFQIHF